MAREIAALGDRAQALARLREHPQWQALHTEYEVLRDKRVRALAARILSTGEVDQREIDHQRGFLKGVEWLLGTPEMTEKALISAIERTAQRG